MVQSKVQNLRGLKISSDIQNLDKYPGDMNIQYVIIFDFRLLSIMPITVANNSRLLVSETYVDLNRISADKCKFVPKYPSESSTMVTYANFADASQQYAAYPEAAAAPLPDWFDFLSPDVTDTQGSDSVPLPSPTLPMLPLDVMNALGSTSPPHKRRCVSTTPEPGQDLYPSPPQTAAPVPVPVQPSQFNYEYQTYAYPASPAQFFPSPVVPVAPSEVPHDKGLPVYQASVCAPSTAPAPMVISSALGPVAVSYNLTPAFKGRRPPRRRSKNAECQVCQKKFDSRYKLKAHMNSHLNKRPFVCDICGQAFLRNHNLASHRRTHEVEFAYSCQHCNRGFRRPAERLLHLLLKVCQRQVNLIRRTTHGWNCHVCHVTFTDLSSVQEHVQQHKLSEGPRRACPVCHILFTGQRDHKILAHVKAYHPDYLRNLG
ncbi:protein krueppel-like [Penaeus indicus]|uniref:protein krueppel-like n=1 Tax=Penaeus indicus TaxID=29960 RepID=UPI00300CDE70